MRRRTFGQFSLIDLESADIYGDKKRFCIKIKIDRLLRYQLGP